MLEIVAFSILYCLFVIEEILYSKTFEGLTIQYQGGLRSRELDQVPMLLVTAPQQTPANSLLHATPNYADIERFGGKLSGFCAFLPV